MSPKWFVPTRYELRHPLTWIHRLRYWKTTFQFDTYSATLVDQVNAFLSEHLPPVKDPIMGDGTGEPLGILPPGAVDFQFYMIPDRQEITIPTPLEINTGYRFQSDRIILKRPVGGYQFSPWQRTCVYSGCCNAPVYRRTSFQQMRAFHWCPQCQTLLTTVDTEAVIEMMFGVGESYVDNDFYVDSTMPPTA